MSEVIFQEIVDILEEKDELFSRNALFDSFTEIGEIQSKLQRRIGEAIPINTLRAYLEILWRRRKIVKIRIGKREGYRSRIGELLRYLYKLKLWTKRGDRERIYEDVSQLKYVRAEKQIPDRVRPVEQLMGFFTRKEFKNFLSNPFDINPVHVVCHALKISSYKYEKLSDFQIRSCRKIAFEWIKKRPASLIITAGTGAGKTLAFLITPLIFCVGEKLRNPTKFGTRLMLIYPRNALALNQSELIEELITQINYVLKLKFQEKGLTISPPQLKGPIKDFWGLLSKQGREYLEAKYQEPSEILITNTETLKRRLMDPVFQKVLRTLRCVVFDEIHIFEGLHGTNITFLVRRLKALAKEASGKDLLFIGSSATIAEPSHFATTLFSSEDPEVIVPYDTELSPSGKEYHIFLRPCINRSPLSVAIDATSCILHNNREEGLAINKLNRTRRGIEDVEKAIAFADSLDIVNRWQQMLRNNEKSIKVKRILSPNFARFYRPFAWHDKNEVQCKTCEKQGIDSYCKYYQNGQCWFLMRDNPYDKTLNYECEDGKLVKLDAIWVNPYTAKTEPTQRVSNIQQRIFSYKYPPPDFVDLVIATTALEVGIDFSRVREILLYRALRSPVSYKQRSGRGGRELNSSCLITTIVSSLPKELYYFRHYISLVTPSFQPIPLKALNLEVIRNHMFCALFDLAALKGIDIWTVSQNPRFFENVKRAKEFAKTEEAKRFLASIFDDHELIEETISNFIKVLDMITSEEIFEIIETSGTFVDVINKLLTDPYLFKKIQMSLRTRKSRIENAVKQLNKIRISMSECYDVLKELKDYPEIQKELFNVLRKIDEVFL